MKKLTRNKNGFPRKVADDDLHTYFKESDISAKRSIVSVAGIKRRGIFLIQGDLNVNQSKGFDQKYTRVDRSGEFIFEMIGMNFIYLLVNKGIKQLR